MKKYKYATDVERRRAVTRAFDLFPQILTQFALRCEVVPKNDQDSRPMPHNVADRIKEIVAAQFVVRLLRSRDRVTAVPNEKLEEFCQGAIARYHDFVLDRMPYHYITASTQVTRAFDVVVEELALCVYKMLADLPAIDPDFHEPSFWRDVVLGIAETGQYNAGAIPNLVPAMQAILLDNLDDWAEALKTASQVPPLLEPFDVNAVPTRH